MLIDFRAIPKEFVSNFDETASSSDLWQMFDRWPRLFSTVTALASLPSLARNCSFGFRRFFVKKPTISAGAI
jgi:hypothetical protein